MCMTVLNTGNQKKHFRGQKKKRKRTSNVGYVDSKFLPNLCSSLDDIFTLKKKAIVMQMSG